MKGDRAAVRVYHALVGLYPREFRDEYGTDMVQLLRDQCADEPAWQVCSRAVLDLLITIPTQHLEAHMHRTSTHLVPLLYTAVAVGGLLLGVIGGTNAAVFAIGMAIAIVAGITAAIAWKRSGPVGGRVSTGGWWKLVLAGPCIILAVFLAAGFGVDAWLIGMFFVLVAFALTGTGLLLGIVHLAKRHSRAIPT